MQPPIPGLDAERLCAVNFRGFRGFGGRRSFSRRKHLCHSVKIMAEQFNTQPPIAEPLVTATQHTQLYQKSAKVVLSSMRRLQKSGWRNKREHWEREWEETSVRPGRGEREKTKFIVRTIKFSVFRPSKKHLTDLPNHRE